MTFLIRDAHPGDAAAIADMHRAAFGAEGEAMLVDSIRADGDAALSLVAVDDEAVAGHILFSPMTAPRRALALAPLGVLPERQGRGIGSALVREGLARAVSGGWQAVFVLGDPAYYGRFGFSVDAARGFDSPYAGDHFMVLALERGAVPMTGQVRHAPAFARL
jgi:putative acetyltransferase